METDQEERVRQSEREQNTFELNKNFKLLFKNRKKEKHGILNYKITEK